MSNLPAGPSLRLWSAGLLLASGLLAATGCRGHYPETVPVYGQITLGGGPWPKPGRLYFNPLEPAEGTPRRSAVADFDTAGRFRAVSWNRIDGLVPGKYKVGVECWKVAPAMEGPPPVSYVATPYQAAATSRLELTVEPGSSGVEVHWDIPRDAGVAD